jgi:hypothetical protein
MSERFFKGFGRRKKLLSIWSECAGRASLFVRTAEVVRFAVMRAAIAWASVGNVGRVSERSQQR